MAMFRCTGVVVLEAAAHCNVVYIPLITIASFYGYVGCLWLLLDLFVLLVVVVFSPLAEP
jgi:hypothetical protein